MPYTKLRYFGLIVHKNQVTFSSLDIVLVARTLQIQHEEFVPLAPCHRPAPKYPTRTHEPVPCHIPARASRSAAARMRVPAQRSDSTQECSCASTQPVAHLYRACLTQTRDGFHRATPAYCVCLARVLKRVRVPARVVVHRIRLWCLKNGTFCQPRLKPPFHLLVNSHKCRVGL